MDKINGAGHVAREFVAEDAGTSRPPTEITAEWLNTIQRELVALVEGAGLVLSSLDDTQVNKAIRKIFQQASPITAVAGGTVDAITAAFTPAVTTDVAGRIPTVTVMIIATGANTTAGMTIDVGTGAFGVTKGAGAAIVAGDVHGAGHVLHVRGIRGANAAADKWVLLTPATGVTSASVASVQGVFKNLQASATGTSATVSMSADEIAVEDSSNTYKTLRNVSLLINSAGSGANGLDTGALTASTWYSVWAIYNPTTTTTAGLLSLSTTAPTMPGGYTMKARIGWVRTDGTANKYPLGFTQYGRRVQYKVAAGSNLTAYPAIASGVGGTFSQTAPTYVPVSVSNFVPPTAGAISATLLGRYGNLTSGECNAAPNASFSGSSSTNPPPMHIDGTTTGILTSALMLLEGTNVYYAGQSAGCALLCNGWEDNL